jgi:PKHD-type hydroxylase
MMYRVLQILTDAEIAECRRIAASAPFVDGKITNPHNLAKQNEQLHDPAAYQTSSELLKQALARSPEFVEFAFPVALAPPMMTRYKPGMKYGAHADAAFIQLPGATIRSDLSCTIFLNDPGDYEGGELNIRIGDAKLSFKLQPGEAIVYPSDTLHQVVPVTKGERLVAITFIQSRIQDPFRRNLLYELNEVAALEGLKMDPANFNRLQLVQQNLLRHWSDIP